MYLLSTIHIEAYFSRLIYLFIIEMCFESIFLYFVDLNLHFTQLFSSRVTPPASTDVSRFLSKGFSTIKLMSSHVFVFQCFFLNFSKLLARYTDVNANKNISVWRTVEWNWQCFTKSSDKVNHVSIIRLIKEFDFFSEFTQSHLQCNKVTQW